MAQEIGWFSSSSKSAISRKTEVLPLVNEREPSFAARTLVAQYSVEPDSCEPPEPSASMDAFRFSEVTSTGRFKTLVLATLAAVALVAQPTEVFADNSHVLTSNKQSSAAVDAEPAVTDKAPVRTWLDPLRQSKTKKKDTNAFSEPSSDAAANGDFDLSEYSQAPDKRPSVVNVPGNNAIRKTAHSQQLAPLNEPAEPVNGDEQIVIPESTTEQAFYPPTMPETVFSEHPQSCEQHLCWQLLPNGLLYKTYLAGEKEPRMQFVSYYDTKSKRKIWEAVLGGRAGLIRLSDPSVSNGDAFQLDLEGAVFARVLPDEPSAMLEGSDYRVGLYGTWKQDRISYRAGYYHISAHVGDEYLIANQTFNRINYVRDSALFGTAYELTEVSRVYGEIGYALGVEGGAKPLEFQFGGEYAPLPTTQFTGAPFAAVNTHLREDFDFNGGVNVVAGWGWQGEHSKRRLRLGLNYYNGPSLQYEFFDRWENLVGGGIWLDY